MKKLATLLLLLSAFAYSQPNYLQWRAIQPAPGSLYIPISATSGTNTGVWTPTLLTSVIPSTVGLLPNTTSLTINGTTKSFTSTPSFTVGNLNGVLTSSYIPYAITSSSLANSNISFDGSTVGIGTTSNSGRLNIESALSEPNIVLRNGANDAAMTFNMNGSGNDRAKIYVDKVNEFLNFYTLNNNTVFWNGAGFSQVKTMELTYDNKVNLPQLTASKVPYIDASNNLVTSTVTPTELSYIGGLTSSAQTQITTNTNSISTNNSAIGTLSTNVTANTNSITSLSTSKQNTLVAGSNITLSTNTISVSNAPTFTTTTLTGSTSITGTVTAPTPSVGSNDNSVATTSFVTRNGTMTLSKDFSVSSTLTGTTAITSIKSASISANTVNVGDEIEIVSRAERNTTSGTATNYLYVNTSNSLSGATLIGLQSGTSARQFSILRKLWVRSSTESETFNSNTSSSSSDPTVSTANVGWTALNIDWTQTVWIIQAFANAANGDQTTSRGMVIVRTR